MRTPEPARLAEGLRAHTAALAEAVTGADPAAPVPTCPEWRLRDLVGHVGQAHRWTTALVRTGAADAVPDPADADPGPPEVWRGWLNEGAEDLAKAAEDVGPETVVRAFVGPLPVAFWLRRMAHETAVHHADAALATGAAFTIAPDLASDAIREALEFMASPVAEDLRPGLAALRGQDQSIHLDPEDMDDPGWLITRTPEGPRWDHADGETADVSLGAPVRDLLLVFTRRLPLEDADAVVTGERALLDHWLACTAF
ncbi:maleylpyruvate isomerase family mycothiol-dependent enzyme [Actinomadura sp. NEAU-AAG7]|uniref:maleylpyruvate isomerase family mycothiol-dependent enzyme n=1 Tax=Actinomadura sp. NEAU-AAG7 TaxID=2839640 RepID=UPI001BE481FE|nr:maleylpyruvate isomerase family mycothiol-dependent enzyme [Actinomadura sp. NEAU-AAG7]MBT2212625.1 maleylpyruvate isomerase family mycothiol-dependent enzyme [Actinomadura sp. NEAU-AAG7]